MHGASISRWTMAYFAASLVFLLVALALLGCGFGLPSAAVDAPDTLVIVHLVAIGWLGLLFGGALLQFVPVLAAADLGLPALAAPALLLLAVGLGCLSIGFLSMGDHLDVDIRIAAVGGVLLGIGFACLVASLATTIFSRKAFGMSGVLVLAGLAALVVTALSGNLFAGLLSGMLDLPALSMRLQQFVPYHAASGLLGWMTLTAMGVSYRLFSMFLLAPDGEGDRNWIVPTASVALAGLFLAFGAAIWDFGYGASISGVAILAAMALLALYVRDIRRMFAARRRKALELNSTAGLAALGFLVVGLSMLAGERLFGSTLPLGVAGFYVLAMGWLSGLGLAQLYKIVPFLTWLEAYGPVMGRTQVPRVQDLVDESRAKIWFVTFYAGVCVGAIAILVRSGGVLQMASWLQFVAIVGLTNEYLRARCLHYAPADLRLPSGSTRPCLIHATIKE